MIEAQLADGRILEFPAGTSPDVVQRAVKNTLAGNQNKPVPSQIPDTRVDTQQAPQELSMREKISGAIETPMALVANMASGPLVYLSGAAGPEFQAKVANEIQYQPRTRLAQSALEGIGKFMEETKIPPFMPGMQMAPKVPQTASDIALQARAMISQAKPTASTNASAIVKALRETKETPTTQPITGMIEPVGNPSVNVQKPVVQATTPQAIESQVAKAMPDKTIIPTIRQTTAANLRVPVQLTKGESIREPGQQQFEIETAKTYPDTAGKPLIQRRAETNQNILLNFDKYVDATGAEKTGLLRPIGQVVDGALVKQANDAKVKIKAAYEKARASGETKALVPYDNLVAYVNEQGPTVKEKLAPILGAVEDQLAKNDPNKTGMVSIDAMEDIYKFINANAQEGTPNAVQGRQLKSLINASTEGAGGDLYREARRLRSTFGRQFEDVGSVDKLLRTKPGTSDRAVAFEDVFKHSILDGSFDDTRNIAVLLKKGGAEGQQAWKELQGQTIEYIKEQATKNIQRDSRGNPVPSPAAMDRVIKNLDADGKLDYIFGKKGAQEVRDLRDTTINVYSPVRGTANESNTSSALVRALKGASQSPLGRIPGVGAAAEFANQRQISKQVIDALRNQ